VAIKINENLKILQYFLLNFSKRACFVKA
jgi:hypothetical protein